MGQKNGKRAKKVQLLEGIALLSTLFVFMEQMTLRDILLVIRRPKKQENNIYTPNF